MDEKQVKDFDRSIEQLMNEHAVTPPFGMWNRIAGELELPTAAPVTAPARKVPGGLVIGFMAGALAIGTFVTGWFIYNNNPGQTGNATNSTAVEESTTIGNQNLNAAAGLNIAQQEAVSITAGQTETLEPVTQEQEVAIKAEQKVIKQLATKSTSSKQSLAVAQRQSKVTPPTNTEVETGANLSATDVGVPAFKVAGKTTVAPAEVFYFPPVDIQTSQGDDVISDEAEVAENDKEAKTDVKKGNSSSDGRVKFKKRRKSSWSYGRIIHVPKSKGRY